MNKPLLIARFRTYVAEELGYTLVQLLADDLPDDLDDALWCEDGAAILAWFNRELPPEILQAIPTGYQQQFLAGAYSRYFDDFVVRPQRKSTFPSRGDETNTTAPASPHQSLSPEDAACVATQEMKNCASERSGSGTQPYRAFTDQELKALASYERECALLRDKIRAVVTGTKLGVLVHGEAGIGKSKQVESVFQELQIEPILTNSNLSTRGLVDLLQKNADRVHFMEEIEAIFRKSAFGFLRSALWGPKDEHGEMRRMATWVVHDDEIRILFTGKLILTANCPLADLPELRALATRIVPYHFHASNAELLAMMKKMCNAGYGPYKGVTLTPEKCFEVFDFYVAKVPPKRHHDLRILEHGFWDYIDSINGVLRETTWQEQFLAEILRRRPARDPQGLHPQ